MHDVHIMKTCAISLGFINRSINFCRFKKKIVDLRFFDFDTLNTIFDVFNRLCAEDRNGLNVTVAERKKHQKEDLIFLILRSKKSKK